MEAPLPGPALVLFLVIIIIFNLFVHVVVFIPVNWEEWPNFPSLEQVKEIIYGFCFTAYVKCACKQHELKFDLEK